MVEDAHTGRRTALVLTVLRLSRDPDLLPHLEAAAAALDDGRRPWADPPDEAALLQRARERVETTLEAAAWAAWQAGWQKDAAASGAAVESARLGRGAPPPDTPPLHAAAASAAGELLARLQAGGSVDPGTTSSDGWTVVALLPLDGLDAWLPTEVWALWSPDRSALVCVATGNCAPEIWDREQVGALREVRHQAHAAAEAFVRAAERADPTMQAERRARREAFFQSLDERRAGRRSVERHGGSTLRLHDGRPVEVQDAVLVGADGEVVRTGIEARRIDGVVADLSDSPPAARSWDEQVWVRPLGGGVWRRGRLRPRADGRMAFHDHASASEAERGDGAPAGGEPPRTLERDLTGSLAMRSKAAAGITYARLLYAALRSTAWRHRDGTVSEAAGPRLAGDIVAAVTGRGDYLTWAWSQPDDLLDEDVVADLRALGWVPEGG